MYKNARCSSIKDISCPIYLEMTDVKQQTPLNGNTFQLLLLVQMTSSNICKVMALHSRCFPYITCTALPLA